MKKNIETRTLLNNNPNPDPNPNLNPNPNPNPNLNWNSANWKDTHKDNRAAVQVQYSATPRLSIQYNAMEYGLV